MKSFILALLACSAYSVQIQSNEYLYRDPLDYGRGLTARTNGRHLVPCSPEGCDAYSNVAQRGVDGVYRSNGFGGYGQVKGRGFGRLSSLGRSALNGNLAGRPTLSYDIPTHYPNNPQGDRRLL